MTYFGTTADGREVTSIDLGAGDLSVRLLTYGAILNRVMLKGVPYNLTAGSDTLADYEGAMRYHGALVGPVVNRLSNAQAPISGQMHWFDANQDSRLTLHSGSASTGAKVWDVIDHGPAHVTMALDMADGEGGFPGNRQITARFEVAAPATLRMTLEGATDKATLMNFANHSYWNLEGAENYGGHSLWVDADHYLPTTPDIAPTGEIAEVTGTAMDFRTGREIAPQAPPLDTCFCLSKGDVPLRDVLRLTADALRMTIATTAPGIQVFDNRPEYRAVAIEAQGWPDAPNHAGFPSIELQPGQTYRQVTAWRFDRS